MQKYEDPLKMTNLESVMVCNIFLSVFLVNI